MRSTRAAERSLPQALQRGLQHGVTLLREQRLGEAEQALQQLLRRWPGQPDALQFLGVLRHLQQRSDEAITLLRRALAAAPGHAGAWNNLGNVLLATDRLDDAAQAYQRSVEAGAGGPEAAEAQANLGIIHRKRRQQRIRTLLSQGERDAAAALFREWLAEDPAHPVPRHMLAGCLGEDVPARASDAYVEHVFDLFATSFDTTLGQLKYRAPQQVAQALGHWLGAPAAALDIADLGCGTGLCGPLLRAHAHRLAGVDLSAGMLARARERQVYDTLDQAELVQYLQSRPRQFDVLVATDTFIYFGVLDAAMQAARQALRPGGWVFFSFEALADDDTAPHRLQPSGRYAHQRHYLLAVLQAAGLRPQAVETVPLRTEGGQPVPGWLVVARAEPAGS